MCRKCRDDTDGTFGSSATMLDPPADHVTVSPDAAIGDPFLQLEHNIVPPPTHFGTANANQPIALGCPPAYGAEQDGNTQANPNQQFCHVCDTAAALHVVCAECSVGRCRSCSRLLCPCSDAFSGCLPPIAVPACNLPCADGPSFRQIGGREIHPAARILQRDVLVLGLRCMGFQRAQEATAPLPATQPWWESLLSKGETWLDPYCREKLAAPRKRAQPSAALGRALRCTRSRWQ